MYKNIKVERAMQWIKDNPDKFKENQKRYRDKRKSEMTEEEHQELLLKSRIQNKKWRDEHPEEVKEKKCLYSAKRRKFDPIYREKLLQRKRDWDLRNKKHNREYANNRYRNNDVVREKHSIRSKNKQVNERLETIYWYSNGEMKCNICGNTHYEFLAIDHIDNNGYIHRQSGELKRYSNDLSKYLIANNFPEGYQILCHNCNQIKRIESLPFKNNPSTKYRRKERHIVLLKYSNNNIKCKYCGETDERCLTLHHVHGGGMKEKRDIGYYSLTSYLYKNDVPLTDIEVLCQNCNKSLGHYGYLPS
jgi:hypothetical protein